MNHHVDYMGKSRVGLLFFPLLNMVDLPDDVAALKAIVIAVHARNERLELLVAAFRQAMFGRKSEKIDPDQFDLALEDIETAIATIRAEDEVCEVTPKPAASSPRAAHRGSLPKHLPRVEDVIEPEARVCGCGGGLHRIGEEVSERLDVIAAQVRVIMTRRPKYACRSCSNGVVQAPAPARLIAGARRKLFEVARNSTAPIAEDVLKHIGELYKIEAEIRGMTPEARRAIRQDRSASKIADFKIWWTRHRARASAKSPLGEALK